MRGDRIWPFGFDHCSHAGGGGVRHDLHRAHSDGQLLRPARSGLVSLGRGARHRHRLSVVLVPADQRRRLHQGARVPRALGQPPGARDLHGPLHRRGRAHSAETGGVSAQEAAPHPRARIEGVEQHPRRPDPVGADGLYVQLRRLRRRDRGQDRSRSCVHRHCRRGPFRALPTDPASHPSALVPAAGRDSGDRNRSVDGREPVRVRDRDSAQVRAGRHLESLSEPPDQYGCDGGRPGRQRRGLFAADHQPGGANLRHARRRNCYNPQRNRNSAGQLRPSRDVQPQSQVGMVQLGDAGHQQHHHAFGHPDRRRAHSRARAWDDRASARDASDAERNHAGEDLGERSRDPGGGDPLGEAGRAIVASGPDRWLARSVHGGSCRLRLFRHLDGHSARDLHDLDGAIRPFGDPGPRHPADAVRLRHADGDHAGLAAVRHASLSHAAFCQLFQAVLYRAAGLDVVWPELLVMAVISAFYFAVSGARFRRTLVVLG